jgi:hypothetical protein
MAQAPVIRVAENHINCQPFSNFNFNMLLATNTALAYTVPGVATQKFRIKFSRSSTAEVWVGYNKTPSEPSSNTATTNAYQEIVPLDEARFVNGGDTLTFLSASANKVSGSLLLIEDTTGM